MEHWQDYLWAVTSNDYLQLLRHFYTIFARWYNRTYIVSLSIKLSILKTGNFQDILAHDSLLKLRRCVTNHGVSRACERRYAVGRLPAMNRSHALLMLSNYAFRPRLIMDLYVSNGEYHDNNKHGVGWSDPCLLNIIVPLFLYREIALTLQFRTRNRCHCFVAALASTLSNTLPTMDQRAERSDTMLPSASVPLSWIG